MTSSEKMQAQYEKLFGDARGKKAHRKAKKKTASAQHCGWQEGLDTGQPVLPQPRRTASDAGAGRSHDSGTNDVAKQVMEQLGIGLAEQAPKVKRAKAGSDPHVPKQEIKQAIQQIDRIKPKKRRKAK